MTAPSPRQARSIGLSLSLYPRDEARLQLYAAQRRLSLSAAAREIIASSRAVADQNVLSQLVYHFILLKKRQHEARTNNPWTVDEFVLALLECWSTGVRQSDPAGVHTTVDAVPAARVAQVSIPFVPEAQ